MKCHDDSKNAGFRTRQHKKINKHIHPMKIPTISILVSQNNLVSFLVIYHASFTFKLLVKSTTLSDLVHRTYLFCHIDG